MFKDGDLCCPTVSTDIENYYVFKNGQWIKLKELEGSKMNVNVPLITRTGEPSKLDTAEFGTLCKVMNTNGIVYYIQLSNDSENPKWTYVDCDDEDEAIKRATELKN